MQNNKLSYFHLFSVFVWTGGNDSNTLRVDAYFWENGEKISVLKNIRNRVDVAWNSATVRKHTSTNFSFSFYTKTWIRSPRISIPGKVTCIWHFKRVEMIAKNFLQKRQKFSTTDVFAAIASSLLKLPNHFFCKVSKLHSSNLLRRKTTGHKIFG